MVRPICYANSIAVKEIVKSRLDRVQYPTNLQILAPAPGSVRVVFRSPARRDEGEDGLTPASEVNSIEGDALATVTELVRLVQTATPDGDDLEHSLRQLYGSARNAVRLIAPSVVDGQWEISGELRRGFGKRTSVSMSNTTAQRLARAAAEPTGEIERSKSIDGVVDGWSWSEGQMAFLPSIGKSFKASVAESLQGGVLRFLENKRPVCCRHGYHYVPARRRASRPPNVRTGEDLRRRWATPIRLSKGRFKPRPAHAGRGLFVVSGRLDGLGKPRPDSPLDE